MGSFLEDYTNKVHIVKLNEEKGEFEKQCEFDHPYPPTKIIWSPDKSVGADDMLATTGDYLRLWKKKDDSEQFAIKSVLNNVRALLPRPRPLAARTSHKPSSRDPYSKTQIANTARP
jgi:hypothetical protein